MEVWLILGRNNNSKFTQKGCASFKALYEKNPRVPKILGNFVGEAFSF